MAFAASLAELQAEASCSLCLDYLRDPVTLDCGHNFCESCIHDRWKDIQDVFPCPICLYYCSDGDIKRNIQLSYITDIIKQLRVGKNKRKWQETELLCEKHDEVLDLFCEEDLELLCPQCRDSPDHQDHHLIPTERAAENQRKKFKRLMEHLKKQINDAKKECKYQLTKYMEEKWKIENCKGELVPEFKQFNLLLKGGENLMNDIILIEMKIVKDQLTRNRIHLSNHIETLKNLLSEVTEKCLQDNQNLLTSIKSTHSRCESLSSPELLSYKFKKGDFNFPAHYFSFHKMISTFQENLTLDLKVAHQCLIVSEDKKSVTFGTKILNILYTSQTVISYPAVLCCEEFEGGRHFWQVEVKGSGEWSLGLCKEIFRQNVLDSSISDNDFWQLEQTSLTHGTSFIDQEEHVRRIGVFLDYELGELSFYNMNNKACLLKITDTFTEKVIPYFAIGPTSENLTISLVIEQ
ncbi:tripartite motif-containing protein 60-like [Suncus etruscus]|uniref:tripartite motif-containing protein 60-like n=1 Tax=Suncus etruscus TaxID=109475 RepID=UPI0021109BF7|nr:tripartite motif-containing protein 60-like [Suncus etruscus]